MLSGTIDDISPPEVFKVIGKTRKSGEFRASKGQETCRVRFRLGVVVHAESSLSQVGFGRKLIDLGALTDQQLQRATEFCATTGEDLGVYLVERGLVARKQLDDSLREEIEEAIFELFLWRRGEFSFHTSEPGPETWAAIQVDDLIGRHLESAHELARLSGRLPVQAVLRLAPMPGKMEIEVTIRSDEWPVLSLVDGHRTVEEIVASARSNELVTMSILDRLIDLGLVEQVRSQDAGPDLIDLREHFGPQRSAPPPPPHTARSRGR